MILIWVAYRGNKPEGVDAVSPQHQAMAQHYLDVIKQGLREFNHSYSPDVYEKLAWSGLQGTVRWKNLGTDTLDIKESVSNFITNNPPCSID